MENIKLTLKDQPILNSAFVSEVNRKAFIIFAHALEIKPEDVPKFTSQNYEEIEAKPIPLPTIENPLKDALKGMLFG